MSIRIILILTLTTSSYAEAVNYTHYTSVNYGNILNVTDQDTISVPSGTIFGVTGTLNMINATLSGHGDPSSIVVNNKGMLNVDHSSLSSDTNSGYNSTVSTMFGGVTHITNSNINAHFGIEGTGSIGETVIENTQINTLSNSWSNVFYTDNTTTISPAHVIMNNVTFNNESTIPIDYSDWDYVGALAVFGSTADLNNIKINSKSAYGLYTSSAMDYGVSETNVTMTNSEIHTTGANADAALNIYNGGRTQTAPVLTIRDSKLTTEGDYAVALWNMCGAITHIENSFLSTAGNTYAIYQGGGLITLSDSTVEALNGQGIYFATIDPLASPETNSIVELSHSTITASNTAIVSDNQRAAPYLDRLILTNGSKIQGLNGKAIEVLPGSLLSVNAENSEILGDINVAQDSNLSAVLHQSTFTGSAMNIFHLELDDNSTWNNTGVN